jgi:hypothetical protein
MTPDSRAVRLRQPGIRAVATAGAGTIGSIEPVTWILVGRGRSEIAVFLELIHLGALPDI